MRKGAGAIQALMGMLLIGCGEGASPAPDDPAAANNDGGRGGKTDVYGEDTRRELFEVADDPVLGGVVAASVVLVDLGKLAQEGSAHVRLRGDDLREVFNVCETERFADQPSVEGACSGFLVAPDLVMTAGHCFEEGHAACDRKALVFGYGYAAEGADAALRPVEDVHFCQAVLWYEDTDVCERDVALIRIDPPAPASLAPLPLRREGRLGDGAEIAVVGHPLGWPLKVDVGAVVVGEGGVDHMITFADTNSGNSGGMVVDRATGVVEGVHICGGERAGLATTPQGCQAQRQCEAIVEVGAEECGGARAMRVTAAAELVGPGWATFVAEGDEVVVEGEGPAQLATVSFGLRDPGALSTARVALIAPGGERLEVWTGGEDRISLFPREQFVRLDDAALGALAGVAGAWRVEVEGGELAMLRLNLRLAP